MRTALAELAGPAVRGMVRGAGIGGVSLGLTFWALGYSARVSCPLGDIALAGLVLGALWLGPLVGSAAAMGKSMRREGRIRKADALVLAASIGAVVSALGATGFFRVISALDPREVFDYTAIVLGGLAFGGVVAPAFCHAFRAWPTARSEPARRC